VSDEKPCCTPDRRNRPARRPQPGEEVWTSRKVAVQLARKDEGDSSGLTSPRFAIIARTHLLADTRNPIASAS